MQTSKPAGYPYSEIIDGLIRSIMLAQRSVVISIKNGSPLNKIDHSKINRFFCWLSYLNKEGENRHLVEAPEGMAPLATSALRSKAKIPDALKTAFQKQLFVEMEMSTGGDYITPEQYAKHVQPNATRISSLIVNSFYDLHSVPATPLVGKNFEEYCVIRSPLSIAYDFLTVPDTLGTRAYSLVACRNFLFRTFLLTPDLDEVNSKETFSVLEIEKALSHIWTSFRDRYQSRGEDKLPPGRTGNIDGLIRHHLAMKEMLYLRFRDFDECITYLTRGELVPKPGYTKELNKSKNKVVLVYTFEFTRSFRLESLPEAGELVNELWGLPIPLRGADIIFKGGLKFSGRRGLVMAIHGGPGAGKTSFALALTAYLAPFGITSWFLSAEEIEKDLLDRVNGLIPDQVSRLSFFPKKTEHYLKLTKYKVPVDSEAADPIDSIVTGMSRLADSLRSTEFRNDPIDPKVFKIPKPCHTIVVLDGLHDLFAVTNEFARVNSLAKLHKLIETLRNLHALVILTTGTAWANDSSLDYLVDVAIRLSHESTLEYGKKPERRFILSKARHQYCADGMHGLQIGGMKGVRLSPQINYQLEKLSHWRPRLPDPTILRNGLRRARYISSTNEFSEILKRDPTIAGATSAKYVDSHNSVSIYEGSHVFLNGQGSGGKAALAMKLAISARYSQHESTNDHSQSGQQRVLVVSFLYPSDYYEHLIRRIKTQQLREFSTERNMIPSMARLNVIHLYPGYLKPHDLFNRIEWELEAAELNADPYTCVVIDGIHNIFLQFPEIEKYGLFWPQIYSALRSRKITTITTHTTLSLPYQKSPQLAVAVDDNRSEPLRHALVQKTDYQFEIDPFESFSSSENQPNGIKEAGLGHELFVVKVVSAIGQKIPKGYLLWSREELELFDFAGPTQHRLF